MSTLPDHVLAWAQHEAETDHGGYYPGVGRMFLDRLDSGRDREGWTLIQTPVPRPDGYSWWFVPEWSCNAAIKTAVEPITHATTRAKP